MEKLEMRANAKINLSLSVKGRREDGYHEIDTVIQSIDLYDVIKIQKTDTLTVRCPGIAQQENLAFLAAKLFGERSGMGGGALIEIEKHIPLSSGLGGGSADAAAVLLGLNRLYDQGLSNEKLLSIATVIGADVPFFLTGGTSRARGIGEKLERVCCRMDGVYLLYKEGKKPSTAEMYCRLDKILYPQPNMDAVVNALEEGKSDDLLFAAGNSFSVLWEEGETVAFLQNAGAKMVLLSGSGPTRFALFDEETKAKNAYTALQNKGIESYLVQPVKQAILF